MVNAFGSSSSTGVAALRCWPQAGWLWVATGYLLAAACGDPSGTLSVRVQWPADPGGAPSTVFLRGEVRLGAEGGRVAAPPVGPITFGAPARLALGEVPNGEERVLFVEVTEAADSDVVLFFGQSEPFDLEAGRDTEITVPLVLSRPPSADAGAVSLAGGGSTVPNSVVTLVLRTDTGVLAEVSNLPSFGAEAQIVDLASQEGASAACPPPEGARPNEACTYQLLWNLDGGIDDECVNEDLCRRQVFVRFVNRSGYRSEATSTNVVVDTRIPDVLAATVQYAPAPENFLRVVETARPGTRVVVTLTFSEVVATVPPPRLVAERGPNQLEFELITPISELTNSATFVAEVEGDQADGRYRPLVTVQDLAGNATSTASFIRPSIEVDATSDALVVAQDRVSLVRAPVGNAADEDLTDSDGSVRFTWPGGPSYFALAPADPRSPVRHLPLDTFLLADGTAPSLLLVHTDRARTSLLLIAAPGNDGWDRSALRLANVDTPRVFVSGVDAAGNLSEPVLIESVWFVAAPGLSAIGARPHALSIAPNVTLPLDPGRTPKLGLQATGLDGELLVERATHVWRDRSPKPLPGVRAAPSMVFDAARGVTVLFGGRGLNETWEYDDRGWRLATPASTSPPNRDHAGAAYDERRGRTLVFGGNGDAFSFLNDLWAWDGRDWTEVVPAPGDRPSPRYEPAMTYDRARDRVVVFGGRVNDFEDEVFDTWEFDGEGWTEGTPAGASPGGVGVMAYDARREVSVLAVWNGGTWEWNGSTWVEAADGTGTPPITAIVYDGGLGRVVGFEKNATDNPEPIIEWSWDGARWTRVAQSRFASRLFGLVAAYDAVRGRRVLYDGGTAALGVQAFDWGRSLDFRAITSATPGARGASAMVWDSRRGYFLLFGGAAGRVGQPVLQDTWIWEGSSWFDVSFVSTPPPGRGQHAMAYDPARDRVVLYGGFGADGIALTDTWEWTGMAWAQRAPALNPGPRIGAAMTYDPVRGRVLLFGGETSPGQGSNDLWSWDGTAWRREMTLPSPSLHRGPAMVYDLRANQTLLYGSVGDSAGAFSEETWTWSGTGWADRTPGPTGLPGRFRLGPAVVYDTFREVPILFAGGDDNFGLDDLWEWRSGRWVDISPGPGPSSRYKPAAAFDTVRRRMAIHGGYLTGLATTGDTWELLPPSRASIQFEATVPDDVPRRAVRDVRVRALCSENGSGQPNAGAGLFGYVDGAWQGLDAASDRSLTYRAADPALARRFIGPGRRVFTQCRANSESGSDFTAVTMDYIEVRVRYSASAL